MATPPVKRAPAKKAAPRKSTAAKRVPRTDQPAPPPPVDPDEIDLTDDVDDDDVQEVDDRGLTAEERATLDALPAELKFTTTVPDDGEYSELDEYNAPIEIGIDDMIAKLHRPPNSALAIRVSQIVNATDASQRLLAMLGILEASLDFAMMTYIKNRMLLRQNDGDRYDDGLIGKMVGVVIDKWGTPRDQNRFASATSSDAVPINRKQKRAAARSK